VTHRGPAFRVLGVLTACHLINDLLQALLPALYPLIKEGFALDFWQIGLITFTNQVTASLLQPLVGHYTDQRPHPYSLPIGMTFTLVGLVLLATATRFGWLLAAAACVGIGSSIFHPESSRIARLAWSAAGGGGGPAAGPRSGGVVHAGRACRHRAVVVDWALVLA
jgi:FSR family fosmidomycin resistance protein-like MFS transporter